MKIRSVGAKSCHADKQKTTDGPTNIINLLVALRNYTNEHKMYQIFIIKTYLSTL